MNGNMTTRHRTGSLAIYIHIIAWVLLFTFPLIMESHSDGIRWKDYSWHLVMPTSFLIIFYVNYWVLVPKCLFRKERSRYLLYNALLIVGLVAFFHLYYMPAVQAYLAGNSATAQELPDPHRPPRWAFVVKDCIVFTFVAGLGTVIRLSMQWQKAETARQEAEQSRMEAELNNLRNQLNPHFLLNTLNNIYALIMFDTPRAQEAVQELSRLLRYVLYDNQQRLVALPKEAEFIRNYIELMRIRMPANVTMDIDIGIDPSSKTMIAPLIFISLIENSFKHGISPTQPSHITIRLSEKDGLVTCHTGNSNHPKQSNDKSGSGIGLGQVRRRLDLIYPMRYRWTCTADEKLYVSTLTIDTRHDTTQLHHRR